MDCSKHSWKSRTAEPSRLSEPEICVRSSEQLHFNKDRLKRSLKVVKLGSQLRRSLYRRSTSRSQPIILTCNLHHCYNPPNPRIRVQRTTFTEQVPNMNLTARNYRRSKRLFTCWTAEIPEIISVNIFRRSFKSILPHDTGISFLKLNHLILLRSDVSREPDR